MTERQPLIHARFLAAAQAHPHKPALITERSVTRYGELADAVLRAATALDAQHTRRVAISLPNGAALAEAFFGALAGGAVAMVWDPTWPQKLRDEIEMTSAPDLIADQTWSAWMERQTKAHAVQSQANEDMPFLIGYTSGSSGVPKAFIRSHRSWITSFEASAKEFDLSAADIIAAPGPMSHGLSLYAMVEALCCGATVLTQTAFDPEGFLDLMEQHQATVLTVPPVLLDLLTAPATQASNAVRAIITAGDKLQTPARLRAHELWPEADLFEYYGASELSFVSVAKTSEQAPSDSVGRAFTDVTLELRDDQGQPVAPGVEGEVWVHSSMLCNGYVGEGSAAFRREGNWATVGDRGVLSPEGWLTLTGRAGDMIITAGQNVSPAAVEAVLVNSLETAVAVIGLPNERWGEVVCAVKEGEAAWTRAEQEQAEAAILSSLPKGSLPRAWEVVVRFPRLTSGKIDRRALAASLAPFAESS